MISPKTAQQGFELPVSPKGVAITIPGEQITFIQLSHLSNFVCTTDNGNMCVSGGGTANLIYLRRIQLSEPVPGQLASPDGSTLLLLKTNGGACSSLCPITLVPSSAVPRFNVVEIGGEEPQISRPYTVARSFTTKEIAPIPVPGIPPAPRPTVQVDLPRNFKALQEVPPPPGQDPQPPKESTPVPTKEELTTPVVKVVPPKPKTKKPKKNRVSVKPIAKKNQSKKAPIIVRTSLSTSINASGLPSRVLANKLVMGLAIANRTKEIPYSSPKSLKIQDLVRILRRDRSLPEAMRKSGVSRKDVDRLIQLGTKR